MGKDSLDVGRVVSNEHQTVRVSPMTNGDKRRPAITKFLCTLELNYCLWEANVAKNRLLTRHIPTTRMGVGKQLVRWMWNSRG